MKKFSILFLIFIMMMTSLACGFLGGDDEEVEEEQSAAEVQNEEVEEEQEARPEKESAVDLSMLGDVQEVEEGGYSFQAIPDYEMELEEGWVFLLAPDGDFELGPMIIMSGATSGEKTNEEFLEELKEDMDVDLGDPEEVEIGGLSGLVMDLSGEEDSGTMLGRMALVMVTPTQEFVLMAGASEDQWDELEPFIDPLLASIEFFELPEEAVSMSSGLDAGEYVYVNRNAARDLTVHNGVIYTATLGGMVAWRLDSGYMMAYTPMDGMGHISADSVAICNIPEERLVVGTLEGLSFYDPSTGEWEQRDMTPDDSWVDENEVTRLYCDSENQRLIIGYNGLGVLDLETGDFTRYSSTDDMLAWNAVTDIAVNGEDIWVAGGYNGISVIQGDEVTIINEENGLPDDTVYSLAFAPDGTLWAGASDGLMKLKGNQWTLYDYESPVGLSSVSEIEISEDGDIWLTTIPWGAGRVCLFDPETEECVVDFEDEDGMPIYGLALDEEGNPVYATDRGVYLYKDGAVTSFISEDDQLASNFVDSIEPSADGRLWIGTDAGIHLMDPASPDSEWVTYDRDTIGLGGTWAGDVDVADDGTTWFAITNGEASRFKDGEWTSFEDVYSYSKVAVDSEGNAWFSYPGKGLIVLDSDGNIIKELTEENGDIPDDDVYALLAQDDIIWIGSNSGLAKYEDGEIEIVFDEEDNRLPSPYIRDLELDMDGNLVIGCNLSVVRYNGSQVELICDLTRMDDYDWVTDLAVTPDNNIYVGTYNGVYYLDKSGDYTYLSTEDGLLTNGISAMHVDQFGNVWIGGGGSNYDGGGLVQIVNE